MMFAFVAALMLLVAVPVNSVSFTLKRSLLAGAYPSII
jgi:hypothetical protein